MATQSALLLIADIAGYTRFMKFHTMSLVHAHEIVSNLLETVIDAAGPRWKLAKLEGDAAFFYLPLADDGDADPAWITARVAAIHDAHRDFAADLAMNTLCPCDGCRQAGRLRIKVVGHLGEVAVRKVKHLTELAGVDVIVVHRMLKNRVPLAEYLLMTEPFYRRVDASAAAIATPLVLELDDLGPADTWYVDLEQLDPRADTQVRLGLGARLWRHLVLIGRSVPWLIGRRKACDGFRNVDPT